jgi:hypothetical protein
MPIRGRHKFCSILWSGKQMALRMLPNRSKLNGSSPGVSDGTREANCKLCLCASADWRWLVLATNRWADTRGFHGRLGIVAAVMTVLGGYWLWADLIRGVQRQP